MLTLTPTQLRATLARELRDPETPRWERNEERLICQATADKLVDAWPPFMPYPTPGQVRVIAARVKQEIFRPEDLAGIIAPVGI